MQVRRRFDGVLRLDAEMPCRDKERRGKFVHAALGSAGEMFGATLASIARAAL